MKKKAFSMIELLSILLFLSVIFGISISSLTSMEEANETHISYFDTLGLISVIDSIKNEYRSYDVISDGTYSDIDKDGFSDDLLYNKEITLRKGSYFTYNSKTCTNGYDGYSINFYFQNENSHYYSFDSCINGKPIFN